jgi:hypothetical protein
MAHVVRDREGRLVAHARSAAGAHRATRRANMAGARVTRSIDRWDDRFGSAENARAAGVRGRLAEVGDGTDTYIESTRERSAAAMLSRFARTADYTGKVTLHGRIVAADGSTADQARLTVDYGGED